MREDIVGIFFSHGFVYALLGVFNALKWVAKPSVAFNIQVFIVGLIRYVIDFLD